jgi:hypothetical protein
MPFQKKWCCHFLDFVFVLSFSFFYLILSCLFLSFRVFPGLFLSFLFLSGLVWSGLVFSLSFLWFLSPSLSSFDLHSYLCLCPCVVLVNHFYPQFPSEIQRCRFVLLFLVFTLAVVCLCLVLVISNYLHRRRKRHAARNYVICTPSLSYVVVVFRAVLAPLGLISISFCSVLFSRLLFASLN